VDVKELMPLLAWASVESGDMLRAQDLLEQLLAETRAAQMRLVLAEALRAQGLLATRQGRWQEAEAALEEALGLARSFPYPYLEAKILMRYGELLMQQNHEEQARQQLEAALAILARLGERLYARQIEHTPPMAKGGDQ
jgi:tetratricopeptide (TPR) repeat protein